MVEGAVVHKSIPTRTTDYAGPRQDCPTSKFAAGGNDMQDLKFRILAFANHVGSPKNDPELKAKARRWLDARGRPTAEGRALISALEDQRTTRSTFRSVA
jgi:hypothetical protein